MLSRLVLLSSCRHITPSLMRLQIITWLARSARQVLSQGLDAIMRLRPFEFELVSLGNYGVINTTSVVWGLQYLYHYVVHASGLVFSISNATVVSVY